MRRALLVMIGLGVFTDGCAAQPPTAPDRSATDGVECGRFPPQTTSVYVLPYEAGQSAVVSRTTEHGAPQLYAVDFLRLVGSAVVAARAGRVVEIDAQWEDADHAFGHENHVFIEHDDGTVARYFHLTKGGTDVALGEAVARGQPIGRSGNSGNSTIPHLHFDVVERRCQTPWPAGPYSDACHNTVPVTFRNTQPHTCGVVSGATYTALR